MYGRLAPTPRLLLRLIAFCVKEWLDDANSNDRYDAMTCYTDCNLRRGIMHSSTPAEYVSFKEKGSCNAVIC